MPAEQTIDPKKAANKTPKRSPKAKDATSDNGQCATEKKEFQNLWAKAGQLRKILIPTVAQTSQLLQMIQKNELGWGWANNPQHYTKLHDTFEALNHKFSQFHIKYLSEKPESVRKHFKDQPLHMRSQLELFTGFKEERDTLQKLNDMLVAKHQIDSESI